MWCKWGVKKTTEKATEKWEKCAKEMLSFDDKAAIAIYLYADVALKPQAMKAIKKFRQVCSLQFPELRTIDVDTLETEIGWDGLYNSQVKEIVEQEFGFKTFVDTYGAYCWEDKKGEKTCGDQSGFFPFYTSEKLLREDLEEGVV
jgi:hypothetical protein